MAENHHIYPVFLPHAGCPYQCVYCNQHAVTGIPPVAESADDLPQRVRESLENLFQNEKTFGLPGEIAFYGGTFTALDDGIVRRILDAALQWVRRGRAAGIRFSTRPDDLSREMCSLLMEYPVRTVELGAQSFSDRVLEKVRRGYSAASVEAAAATVKENGWNLGIQLMAGLPGDTAGMFLESVVKATRLRPSFVRLYPTVVLEGTLLAEWFRRGEYRPLGLDEAIEWCVPALDVLRRTGIPVARMGLHPEPGLVNGGTVLGGPFHPAFGHMVKSAWWRRRVDESLEGSTENEGRTLTIHVAGPAVSEVVGHCRGNVLHWKEKMCFDGVRVIGCPGWEDGRLECSIADTDSHRSESRSDRRGRRRRLNRSQCCSDLP